MQIITFGGFYYNNYRSPSLDRVFFCSKLSTSETALVRQLLMQLSFRQFLRRGNKKVRTEMLLMAMSYNVNKLHHKIQANRTGIQLFEKRTA